IHWRGQWDMSSQSGASSVEISQLPIKDVLNELYQMDIIDREVQIRARWLSCGGQWEGSLLKLSENPVRLSDCKIEGAYGGIHLEEADLYPFEQSPFKVPAEFRIKGLKLQPLVEALNRKVLPTVIAKLGSWSGQVR